MGWWTRWLLGFLLGLDLYLFCFNIRLKMYNVFSSGCFYMVNIYQNCYIWLSLLEGLRERDTFHCLPTLIKEWEFQQSSSSVPSPRNRVLCLSIPGLDLQPFSPGHSNLGFLPLPTIHFHEVCRTAECFPPLPNSAERDKGKKTGLLKKLNRKQKELKVFFLFMGHLQAKS